MEQQQHHRISSHNSLPEMDAASAESLDGDEPPVFFELLSQTGSEMMMVRSREKKKIPPRKNLAKKNDLILALFVLFFLIHCHNQQSSRSIENIVRERINSDEAEDIPLQPTADATAAED